MQLDTEPQVSIVVPTFREAENLPVLVRRIGQAMSQAELSYEIIVVDDASPDPTSAVCGELSRQFPLRLIVRQNERGLSSAVIRGGELATGKWLVVMDADLSHPPERIPDMVAQLASGATEFVLGSRYTKGGSTATDWGLFRRWNSRIATWLARPLTRLSDPMAGFFAMPRSLFAEARQRLNPVGYKIALELLVKAAPQQPTEIPIHFEDRQFGTSKMDWRQQALYLRHLARLYAYRYDRVLTPLRFLAVGGSGAVVDLSAFAGLLTVGVPVAAARGLAVLLAMTANYIGNERFTFRPARGLSWTRYGQFCGACAVGAAVNWLVSLVILRWSGWGAGWPMAAAAAGIVAGAWFNYQICRGWIFSRPTAPARSVPAHHLPSGQLATTNHRPTHDQAAA